MPVAYNPNMTSPCRLKPPQTFRFGTKAEMIKV